MSNESFELIIEPHFKEGKKYRMQVTVTYQSDQVVRFRITGGDKYIVLEKRLLSKAINTWKVPDSNIDFIANGIEISNFILYEIQERLDAWLNRYNQRPPGNPKYEH